MRQQWSHAARTLLVAAFVFGLSVSAFAQAPAAPAGALVAQAPLAGPVRPLSLEEAVKLALENNLGLKVERINPELQEWSITQAKTVWTPNLTASVTNTSRTSPITGAFAGATGQLTNQNISSNVGANQLLPTGGNYTVTWDTSRGKSNSVFDSPNPSLVSNLRFNFNQPLWRNFKIDGARQQLRVSQVNRDLSDVALRQTVLITVRNVKYAYWDVKAAVAAMAVAQQSLDLARESLRNNRSRVEIGTMAPIDVVLAEAEVARREEALIRAESAVRRTEDRLRTLVLDSTAKEFWNVGFELTEQPVFDPRPIDLDGAVKTALEKRTDLRQARKSIELTESSVLYLRNQILPDVNAQVGYGLTGQGGTTKIFGSGFPPVEESRTVEGFGTVMSRLLGNDFHNWSLSVQVSYPIGTSNAEANLARTRLQVSQARIQLQNQELQVVASVRDVARQLDTNQKRLAATQAARRLAERQLDAEQKKFAAGMSTNFFVFQAQRDLADARYNELSALLDYNRSRVDFETVQEAPTAGGSTVAIGG